VTFVTQFKKVKLKDSLLKAIKINTFYGLFNSLNVHKIKEIYLEGVKVKKKKNVKIRMRETLEREKH
jgi:hypothetical protein